jgi:transposase
MPRQIKLRILSADEEREVRRLANARKESVEMVRRARLIAYLLDHPEVAPSYAGMEVGFGSNASGAQWVKRFNEEGIPGLQNRPKPGRLPIHTQAERSQAIHLALQKPESLGCGFGLWTLSRLQTALRERHGVSVARSTLWQWLEAEGLAWKRQQSWFQEPEQHDPEFVEKRGPSLRHT